MCDLLRNFTAGDLLYGREGDRKIFRTLIKAKTGGALITVDEYNRQSLELDIGFDGVYTKKESREMDVIVYTFYSFLHAHEKYSPILDGGKGDVDEGHPKIRRACKAMIEYTVSQRKTIHFLLGSLTIEEAVTKGNSFFTESELRYVYRNKEELSSSVKFYNKEGMECPSPWDSAPDLWKRYEPKSKSK